MIFLSDGVYDSASTAAIGVACHEAGHAVQYAVGYAPIKLRAAIIPVTNFGTKIAWPLMLLGILLSGMSYAFYNLVYVGIACFSLSLVFQLITLPVEFNASRRAMTAIREGNILTDEELVGARKTLTAAAMTYVAAVATSLVQLLRLIAIYGRRRRD
jgi:Zn-dependent membrane protease YugP